MTFSKQVLLVAGREWKILRRSRSLWGAGFLLLAVAWLPPILSALRTGSLDLSGFGDHFLLAITLQGVLLPLLALLAGADLFASEWESGTLVPVVTLPLSRKAVFLGKCLGRLSLFLSIYLAASSSAVLGVAAVNGFDGASGTLASVGVGFLLCLACGGVGMALGLWGKDRLRAFSASLVAWVLFVFLIDALLLSGLVMATPGPPEDVGSHGYGELASARAAGSGEACPLDNAQSPETARTLFTSEDTPSSFSSWLMVLDPVDLYRFSVLSMDSGSRAKLSLALPGSNGLGTWIPLGLGWVVWILFPALLGQKFFRKAEWK
jgi:Cu-processing system permease protein